MIAPVYNNVTHNQSTLTGQQIGAQNTLSQQGSSGVSGGGVTGINVTAGGVKPVGGPENKGTLLRNGDGSLNTDTIGLAIGGIQTLGALWNSYQQHKIAKEQLALQRESYETNLENNTQTYNTALEDRIRSRHNTEGRDTSETNSYLKEHSL